MSKNNPLTDAEFSGHLLDKRIYQQLRQCQNRLGLKPKEMNILDWGCGRGMDVLWLKERGYNVYGIDPDPACIENGSFLFVEKGYETDRLKLLHPDGHIDFPDHFFHFSFSNQVFEHVENLDLVANELSRVTVQSGAGFHVFPPHKHLKERHLHMPFVHWLPKNGLRHGAISLCFRAGIDPGWPELDSRSDQEKIQTYYRYSVEKTFYRWPSRIKQVFNRHGFRASFETVSNPTVRNHSFLGPVARIPGFRSLLNFGLYTFIRSELLIQKQ